MSWRFLTDAHAAAQTHHYTMHYPAHEARADDPHYVDFNHYHRQHRATARCYIGERLGFAECKDEHGAASTIDANGEQSGVELHHGIVEFSLVNEVDFAALEHDHPGISNPDEVGAWVESDENFRWLCAWHHRGAAGAHTASHSDWEASQYVHGLITE